MYNNSMPKTIIKDSRDREIIGIDSSKIVVARYPDQDKQTKDYIVHIYSKLTGESSNKLIDFLNYVSEQNEFCS